jgi:hypothetical protein
MTRVLYGVDALHVPAWFYVQNQGPGLVSFVGASAVMPSHPLRYGTQFEHVFIVGEVVVRPHIAIGTDALTGTGLGGLATSDHDIEHMLSNGRLIAGSQEMLDRLREKEGRSRG